MEIIQTICTCFHVTNHNECGAVVYSHGTVGCLKNNRTISIKNWKLLDACQFWLQLELGGPVKGLYLLSLLA